MKPWILPAVVAVVLLWIAGPMPSVHGQNSLGQFGYTGQQAVTASAVALPTFASTSVCVKALSTNTSPALVYVGVTSSVTTSTGYPLAASDSVCVPAQNANQVYVIASGTGSSVAILATNQ
jgi:hypothetical protein